MALGQQLTFDLLKFDLKRSTSFYRSLSKFLKPEPEHLAAWIRPDDASFDKRRLAVNACLAAVVYQLQGF